MAISHTLIGILLFSQFFVGVFSDCEVSDQSPCNNKKQALPLKLIAIAAILVSSIIGVSLPLVTRSVPALNPERSLFIIVKSFSSGVILATGFMHVLPDSFDMLTSPCLPDRPWHKFPFTGFLAMLSAIITLTIDSIATSLYNKHNREAAAANGESGEGNQCHSHHGMKLNVDGSQILRYRVIAMVLELGIIVHSVVIGLSLGASSNTCSIKGLIAALCFHQMFEGMGLGGCILQAEYNLMKKATMAFFFSVTTPFGVAMGIVLSSSYRENTPRALVTTGLLNASSSGLLIYMALVNLLASEFMGKKLQGSIKLQVKCYIAVLLGAGGMSLMAKWA